MAQYASYIDDPDDITRGVKRPAGNTRGPAAGTNLSLNTGVPQIGDRSNQGLNGASVMGLGLETGNKVGTQTMSTAAPATTQQDPLADPTRPPVPAPADANRGFTGQPVKVGDKWYDDGHRFQWNPRTASWDYAAGQGVGEMPTINFGGVDTSTRMQQGPTGTEKKPGATLPTLASIDTVLSTLTGGGDINKVLQGIVSPKPIEAPTWEGQPLIQTKDPFSGASAWGMWKQSATGSEPEFVIAPAEIQQQAQAYQEQLQLQAMNQEFAQRYYLATTEDARQLVMADYLDQLKEQRDKIARGESFLQEKGLQDDQQKFQGEENQKGRQFQADQAQIDRIFEGFQARQGREFTAEENRLLREFQREMLGAEQSFAAEQGSLERMFRQTERREAETFEIYRQSLQFDFQKEQSRLDRELETAMFETREGIKLGDLATAKARYDQQIKVQNAQFALSLMQQLAQSPEAIAVMQQSNFAELIKDATGLNISSLMQVPQDRQDSLAAQLQLMPLRELEMMPVDSREKYLYMLAARTGINRERLVAEIKRRASGQGLAQGSGQVSRIPVGV